jgi:flagellar biosynthesis/type III secretory pathway M-ring protein FliF/YscJ
MYEYNRNGKKVSVENFNNMRYVVGEPNMENFAMKKKEKNAIKWVLVVILAILVIYLLWSLYKKRRGNVANSKFRFRFY